MLQLADGCRVDEVILAALAILILAADHQVGFRFGERLERVGMLHLRFAREYVEPDALDARCGAGEVGFDQRLVEAHRLKYLRAAIALQRADAHFGEGLEQALVDGLDEVLLCVFAGDFFRQQATALQIVERLDGQVGINGASSIADEQGEVHHLARLAALDNERDLGAGLLAHQAIVHRGHCQQARDGCIGGIDAAIRDDEQRVA